MRILFVQLPRMLILAGAITVVGKYISPGTNGFLLFFGAFAVEVAVVLLLVGGLVGMTHRVVRVRRTQERTELAASRGWRCEPTGAGAGAVADADLPTMLGATDRHVFHDQGEAVLDTQPVPRGVPAHAVVRGEVDGVGFVAFDYFVPGQFPLSTATHTAWLVELPHALPLLTSAEVFRAEYDLTTDDIGTLLFIQATGREQPLAATDPAYARAALTDDVVAFTREHLPCWWVEGAILASTAQVGYGAPPDLIASRAEKLTWLARALSTPELARHATPA